MAQFRDWMALPCEGFVRSIPESGISNATRLVFERLNDAQRTITPAERDNVGNANTFGGDRVNNSDTNLGYSATLNDLAQGRYTVFVFAVASEANGGLGLNSQISRQQIRIL